MTEPNPAGPVLIQLLAEPARLPMAERDRFQLGLTATNSGNETVDPQLFALRLLVDGEYSPAFDLAIGNGVVPAGWTSLAPGATTRPHYWQLGEALFAEPGEFHLTLRLALDSWSAESTATVLVTP